ncbi:5742_t:CDS:2 [Ambispora leptoticha]|uniref:5742_t:CDS:1 n=1 Tax=Ambispora leptoticha TaxID=144679 RepID=A0A9N8YSB8_9GLOM|nr:5742_t:CDS:2 [Ambispora leptoticha]
MAKLFEKYFESLCNSDSKIWWMSVMFWECIKWKGEGIHKFRIDKLDVRVYWPAKALAEISDRKYPINYDHIHG